MKWDTATMTLVDLDVHKLVSTLCWKQEHGKIILVERYYVTKTSVGRCKYQVLQKSTNYPEININDWREIWKLTDACIKEDRKLPSKSTIRQNRTNSGKEDSAANLLPDLTSENKISESSTEDNEDSQSLQNLWSENKSTKSISFSKNESESRLYFFALTLSHVWTQVDGDAPD